MIARQGHLRKIRAGTTFVWAVLCFWLSAPILFAGTRYARVSPAWFFLFGSLGLLIGTCAALLGTAALMIRSPTEARRLHLPRVPVATRTQFIVFAPALILLIVCFCVASHFSPATLDRISVGLALLGFLAAIGSEAAYLYVGRDAQGNRVSHTRRLAALRGIHDAHDYAYLLGARESSLSASVVRALKMPPRRVQEFMRRRYSTEPREPVRFRVETKEQIELSLQRAKRQWVLRIEKTLGSLACFQCGQCPKIPNLTQKKLKSP